MWAPGEESEGDKEGAEGGDEECPERTEECNEAVSACGWSGREGGMESEGGASEERSPDTVGCILDRWKHRERCNSEDQRERRKGAVDVVSGGQPLALAKHEFRLGSREKGHHRGGQGAFPSKFP